MLSYVFKRKLVLITNNFFLFSFFRWSKETSTTSEEWPLIPLCPTVSTALFMDSATEPFLCNIYLCWVFYFFFFFDLIKCFYFEKSLQRSSAASYIKDKCFLNCVKITFSPFFFCAKSWWIIWSALECKPCCRSQSVFSVCQTWQELRTAVWGCLSGGIPSRSPASGVQATPEWPGYASTTRETRWPSHKSDDFLLLTTTFRPQAL